MPKICERQSATEFATRQNIINLIAEALNARGDLYQPGGAVEVAGKMLAEYERARICINCGARIDDGTSEIIRERPV